MSQRRFFIVEQASYLDSLNTWLAGFRQAQKTLFDFVHGPWGLPDADCVTALPDTMQVLGKRPPGWRKNKYGLVPTTMENKKLLASFDYPEPWEFFDAFLYQLPLTIAMVDHERGRGLPPYRLCTWSFTDVDSRTYISGPVLTYLINLDTWFVSIPDPSLEYEAISGLREVTAAVYVLMCKQEKGKQAEKELAEGKV